MNTVSLDKGLRADVGGNTEGELWVHYSGIMPTLMGYVSRNHEESDWVLWEYNECGNHRIGGFPSLSEAIGCAKYVWLDSRL